MKLRHGEWKEGYLIKVQLLIAQEPILMRQVLVERKAALIMKPAIWGDGRLMSPKTNSKDSSQS